ncbi:MAG: molybdopterin-dependent oxidoreductase [Thiovulaceae bacterium]|nr:molybdopterin-dependent oxidoreductase [Sulfurimonadaceae bacterium]
MQRREFLKTSLVASTVLLGLPLGASQIRQPLDNYKISKYIFPEKNPLIAHSDRPPLLETPRSSFTSAITSNKDFFVRWHSPKIKTHTFISGYRIAISGEVNEPLYISLDSLKNDFEAVEITAVLQCGGNSRSAFVPTTSGIQWGSGAMGCAKWRGARLKEVLKKAGLKSDAKWINFNGSDEAAFYKAPRLIRELKIDEIDDNIIIAYEMNGEDLPYLNGYPVRLVIPGWYSDSWVKMLSEIRVTKDYRPLYYMDSAYTVPDNETESESHDKPAKKRKPITAVNTKSYIGFPTRDTKVKANENTTLKGVAFDGGSGIKEVLISADKGKTWEKSKLGKELSKFAFREFEYNFQPKHSGKLTLMAKAVNNLGEEQPFAHEVLWNKGGYKYNGIDSVTFEVVK